MIKYKFICQDCNQEFQEEMELSEYLLALFFHCPYCGSVATRRKIDEAPNVSYKGDGFTKTVHEEE